MPCVRYLDHRNALNPHNRLTQNIFAQFCHAANYCLRPQNFSFRSLSETIMLSLCRNFRRVATTHIYSCRVRCGDPSTVESIRPYTLGPTKLDGPLSPSNFVPDPLHHAFVAAPGPVGVPVVQAYKHVLDICLVGLSLAPTRGSRVADRHDRFTPCWR